MPSPYLYYTYAFGQNADDIPITIPQTAAIDGSISYYAGFTDPYEYNLLTNPAALPVTRPIFNQLLYDVTNNIQEYQNYGTPQWVSGAAYSGSPGYPIYARVYYSNVVYESQIDLNTNTPGADATWLPISGASDGIQSGMVIDWAGPVAPAGYLITDGSAVLRSSYANLMAAITQTQSGAGFTNGMPTVTGLTNATTTMYPGMPIESLNFAGGTTILSITNATTVVMSSNATSSVTHPITFFNWGNGDGSTTFNVPLLTGKVTANEGGTLLGNASAQVDVVGQFLGVPKHTVGLNEIPQHTHDPLSGPGYVANTGSALYQGAADDGSQQATTGGITGYSSQTQLSLVQPTAIMYKIIKT